jgi:hypothetical protein
LATSQALLSQIESSGWEWVVIKNRQDYYLIPETALKGSEGPQNPL